LRVTFFHAGASRFATPAEIDPDRDPHLFMHGEHAWTVQTCARLARAGMPVALADRAPTEGIVVFHVKERHALVRTLRPGTNVLLVGIRADNRHSGVADAEVVQNGRFADGWRRVFIPFWPQPGLIPRDPSRGDAVRTAAFKGFARNLAAPFRSAAWVKFLAARGIEWVFDAVEFDRSGSNGSDLRWRDYSKVDLIIAVRPPHAIPHTAKPAAKLYNAWHAGVPALFGEEFALRELRRSELDYLEADSLAAVQTAVVRLQGDPGLYRAMVENGHRRACDFTVASILERWRSLLYEEMPALAVTPHYRLLRQTPVAVKAPLRRLSRWLALRPAR
jgi:hypothetical protein